MSLERFSTEPWEKLAVGPTIFIGVFLWSEICREITSTRLFYAPFQREAKRSFLSRAESWGSVRKTVKTARYSNETTKNTLGSEMTNFMTDTIRGKLASGFHRSLATTFPVHFKLIVIKKTCSHVERSIIYTVHDQTMFRPSCLRLFFALPSSPYFARNRICLHFAFIAYLLPVPHKFQRFSISCLSHHSAGFEFVTKAHAPFK